MVYPGVGRQTSGISDMNLSTRPLAKASKVTESNRAPCAGVHLFLTRSARFDAASRLNEIARMRNRRWAAPVGNRYAARWARNSVFPEPGPAVTQAHPSNRSASQAAGSRSSMPIGRQESRLAIGCYLERSVQ